MFSLGKLLVLIALIAIVWYGFKLAGRRNRLSAERAAREAVERRLNEDKAREKTRSDDAAQDMARCPACGTFVPAGAARDCGRDGCPYPG